MIRSYFGIAKNPFATDDAITLLAQQQEIFDILLSHCQIHGLSLVVGLPGTGKSLIKTALKRHDTKRLVLPTISRTLHTYHNTLRILCQAFEIDFDGSDHKCERKLIDEAFALNRAHKMIAPVIDDAHYMSIECLRKIRLLVEDFPKNHNLILIGHPCLTAKLGLSVNADIHSRITYSVELKPLAPDDTLAFIHAQLDLAGLGHNVFTDQALNLIVLSCEGILRRVRNLCIGSLLEAVRDQTRTVGLEQVNRVLRQPHWKKEYDAPAPVSLVR
jgi:type II secretory pathway predicted ATPase ExeA